MVTSRTAPDPIFMAMYAPLYSRLARLLPNCCGPPKKIELALEALHVMRPIFFGSDIVDLTASGIVLDYGAHIRHGLAKYREMVKVDRFYQSVVSRVSLGSPFKTSTRIKSVQTKLAISSQHISNSIGWLHHASHMCLCVNNACILWNWMYIWVWVCQLTHA